MKKNRMAILLSVLPALALTTAQAQLFDRVDGDSQSVSTSSTLENKAGIDLIQYMQNSNDIEADFKQITYNQRGEEISEGHMWIAKPGKFFWDYRTPYAQQIISDGQHVYHYDMDLEQITVRGKDELVGDVAIRLLEGQESLNEEFVIAPVAKKDLPSFIRPSSAAVVYSLTPKAENTEYDGVWVVFEGNALAQVVVDGGTGQQTIMTFSHLQRNQGIDSTKFDFTPPAGVDVVGRMD